MSRPLQSGSWPGCTNSSGAPSEFSLFDAPAPPALSGSLDGGRGGGPRGGSSSSTAGASATPAALREFREAYVSVRARFHAANAKAEALQQAGFAAGGLG